MCIHDIVNDYDDYYCGDTFEELDSLKLAKDLKWIKHEVRKDENVIEYEILINDKSLGDYIDILDEIKDDKEQVLKAINKSYGESLQYASSRLKDDKEVVLESYNIYYNEDPFDSNKYIFLRKI